MKADHLTYQRAATVSVWGLLIQLGLGLILLIYSILGADHAAQTAAIFVLAGIVPWLTLAIVFDQHRRERLESLEAETLDAQSAREASAFAGTDDLRVQAGRLAWMHRWLVPAVSLALAAGLLAVAFVRFRSGAAKLGFDKAGIDQFAKPDDRGWAIAVGIALAVVGFVFARFVSGMAKQKVWQPLRGGSAYAVGASLLGVAMVVGQIFDLANTDLVLRYLQVIIPGFMGLVGIEIVVSFLLNLYRPRKVGEIPRPAFDSPILSFVASPDRIAKTIGEAISYQFGVDVTGSWAYRLVARYVALLVVVGALILWLLTCFAVVGAGERGLRVRSGQFIEEVGPGLYVKAPWPFEVIETHPVGVNIASDGSPGMNLTNARPGERVPVILWTNEHNKDEVYSVVQPSATGQGGEGVGATRDLALIKTEIPLVYTIQDLKAFDQLAQPDFREDLIRAASQRQVWAFLATISEEQLLGPARAEATHELSRRIEDSLKSMSSGVSVVYTGIEGVHPPREAAEKYEALVQTSLQAQRVVEDARAAEATTLANAAGSVEKAREIVAEIEKLRAIPPGAENDAARMAQDRKIDELITGAGGSAAQALAQARAERWAKVMGQRGRSEAYQGQLVAYQANPLYYKTSRYLDVLAEIMKTTRVYIVPDGIDNNWMNIDLQDKGVQGDVFQAGSTVTNP